MNVKAPHGCFIPCLQLVVEAGDVIEVPEEIGNDLVENQRWTEVKAETRKAADAKEA